MQHLRLLASLGALALGACEEAPRTAVESGGDSARIAVAANFTATAGRLAGAFERDTGQRVEIVAGSTGALYAQIVNGAPFDAFLAADVERPHLLEQAGRCVPTSRFTYAVGRLALWSSDRRLVDEGGEVLLSDRWSRLAIAQPDLAPYGAAVREALERLGHWEQVQERVVYGQSVGQVYQFVASGNAELGFVALSQVFDLARSGRQTSAPSEASVATGAASRSAADPVPLASAGGSTWVVPAALHPPIEQQAVLLRGGATAERFLTFLRSGAGRSIIETDGYDVPGERGHDP